MDAASNLKFPAAHGGATFAVAPWAVFMDQGNLPVECSRIRIQTSVIPSRQLESYEKAKAGPSTALIGCRDQLRLLMNNRLYSVALGGSAEIPDKTGELILAIEPLR